jgi:hypothetical protein
VKVLGESLGEEEKIKAAKSESFSEEGAGKRELLVIIGEVLNHKKEKEDGIKVGMISSRDINM